MNGLDRIIKRERKSRYKRLIKLRRARDMSKKHRKSVLKLSVIDSKIGCFAHKEFFLSDLAKLILDSEKYFEGIRTRVPKPVSQKK